MKLVKLALVASCVCLGLSAKSISDYKVGDQLTDAEGIAYFKEYGEVAHQPWPSKELSINDVPNTKEGELIKYGIELLSKTESTLGPKGKLKMTNNNVNCTACHMEDNGNGLPGTKKYTMPFLNVFNNYPKLDVETMKIISLEDRVRQMGGTSSAKFPNDSKEMRAIMAYFKWLKKAYEIKDGMRLTGDFIARMDFPNRMADPVRGKQIYMDTCAVCHGERGQGVKNDDFENGGGHMYPSLLIWTDGGHMSMLPVLARFLRSSMPLGATADAPILSPEDALDVAAFVNTGLVRNPMMTTENRAGLDTAYSKAPSIKPEYFGSAPQQLDPMLFIKTKFGPWKNPNYFPGEGTH
ncbi:c-type cytochrome [Campylobacter sp. faydin G-24]|uniref:C-type cytochrome n=1 Tax=Campylobacter anatolicus TaxID=2829105 RepID=A0ABS5HHJ7_9BACT|nr:c-type cytochrome [Campylobacter anatolicus]MBR8461858.1 c-type cytochrome [Campylobacter anatolicus]MBR8463592.1 c-type cytochrome [Campylobacter anatolicus]MBR8465052.1 c-type cytochrome [Campylobacter anatolicus]